MALKNKFPFDIDILTIKFNFKVRKRKKPKQLSVKFSYSKISFGKLLINFFYQHWLKMICGLMIHSVLIAFSHEMFKSPFQLTCATQEIARTKILIQPRQKRARRKKNFQKKKREGNSKGGVERSFVSHWPAKTLWLKKNNDRTFLFFLSLSLYSPFLFHT